MYMDIHQERILISNDLKRIEKLKKELEREKEKREEWEYALYWLFCCQDAMTTIFTDTFVKTLTTLVMLVVKSPVVSLLKTAQNTL